MKVVFFISAFIFISGCKEHITGPDTAEYNSPKITSPQNKSEFNSLEIIRIEWTSRDSAGYFETQLLDNQNRFYTDLDEPLFDTSALNTSGITDHYYSFSVAEPLQNDWYFGFRVRQIIDNDTSNWSNILSVVVYPISQMTKIPVILDVEYDFVTQNLYSNYSDLVYSNCLNMDSLLALKGVALNDASTIKPNHGEIYHDGYQIGLRDFDRFIFGIDTIPNGSNPFDVIADSYVAGDSVPTLTFYPFGGTHRNFKNFFEEENPQIKMIYILRDTTKINIAHKITAKITFDAYYR